MSTFEKLQQASFRGIPFLISAESTVRGKKTVSHEYVNTDYRYIEEMGEFPPEFTLTCIIHGSDSINLRRRFEQALDKKDYGDLIHPIYGRRRVKVISQYRVSSSDSDVGRHIFDVTFSTSNFALERVGITTTVISNIQVADKVLGNSDVLSSSLEDKYTVSKAIINLKSVKDQINDITQKFNDATDTVTEPIESTLGIFKNTIDYINNNIYYIITSPARLISNINSLYSGFRNIVSSPSQLLEQYLLLTDKSISSINRNTALRVERSNNEIAIRDHLNLSMLNYAIEAAVYKDYITEQDLNETKVRIDDLYNSFLKTELDPNDDVFKIAEDSTIRNNFSSLYDLFTRNFIEREKNIYKIEVLPKRKSSTFLTCYKYFGNADFLNSINDLNPAINHCGFNAEINSVTK